MSAHSKRRREQQPLFLPVEELPPEAGEFRLAKAELTSLACRVGPLDAMILFLIECRTRSAAMTFNPATGKHDGPRPTYAAIPMGHFKRYVRKSERSIQLRLAYLEEKRYISRQPLNLA
jgi:hypothetical protein